MLKIRFLAELVLVFLLGLSIFYNAKLLQEFKPTNKLTIAGSVAANEAETTMGPETDSPEKGDLRTLDDVNTRFASLTVNTNARDLAVAISDVDSWLIEPASYESVKTQLDQQIERLRKRVQKEVTIATQKALSANNGKDAAKLLNEVGMLVSLYPMGESEDTIEQARILTDGHRKLAVNLESMKRVRYNQWAVIRLEQAINGYHRNSSLLSPKKENQVLITSLVRYLGDIDPNLLEPIVLSLYNYVVDITKESISEVDKISLARKITSPTIQRKTLEAF